MAKHYTIARPYAKAVFEQAKADDQLETWSSVLQGLALTANDEQVIHLWHNPKVDDHVLNDLFFQVCLSSMKDLTGKLGDRLKNLIAVLVMEKRLEILPDIRDMYHRLLAAHKNIVEIDVISAFELDDAQQKQFYAPLEKRFNSQVSITFKEDKALISGALLRSGNWVLDGSIRGKINRLSETLATN